MFQRIRFLICFVAVLTLSTSSVFAETYEFGFSKVDVTPKTKLRLSGYASRKTVFEGVEANIFVRAMWMKTGAGANAVLITFDNVGIPAQLTQEVAARLEKKFGLARKDFVISCSHTHSAPHLIGGLSNLFVPPISKELMADHQKYTDLVLSSMIKAVSKAKKNLQPCTLKIAHKEAYFSNNRRRIVNGIVRSGVNPDGPNDQSLPILQVTNDKGEVIGTVFNFACHCTALSANFVNGDWAGYACSGIESQIPGSVAMCTIGCGADINPLRTRETYEASLALAKSAGKEIAEIVLNLKPDDFSPINCTFTSAFDYAILHHEPVSKDEFKQMLSSSNGYERQMADHFLREIEAGREIDFTYPNPIHAWRFGDQLTMVFMGGETVIDYTLRLKKELKNEKLWISAYCDDVFAYVASERVRKEGGYEADRSMVYYMRPSPWVSGTEDVVINKVHELIKQTKK